MKVLLASSGNAALDAQIAHHLEQREFEVAVTVALRGYGPSVLRFLNRAMRDPDTADEVFSAFCEDLWRGVQGFGGRGRFGSWMFRVAWHAACRYWETPWQRDRRALEGMRHQEVAEEVRSVTRIYLQTQAKKWLRDAVEGLPAADRALLSLRIEEKMTLEEAASVLEIRHEAARQRWSRLKRRLAKMINESHLVSDE